MFVICRRPYLCACLCSLAQALKLIDGCEEEVGATESPALQALLWCLRGKAMTLGEEGRGSLEAEVLLADAVKLDPSLIDAWNCLGECFWHRNELETARCTFVCALEHERSADTLRLLNAQSKEEVDALAEESKQRAEAEVAALLDALDEESGAAELTQRLDEDRAAAADDAAALEVFERELVDAANENLFFGELHEVTVTAKEEDDAADEDAPSNSPPAPR